MATREDRVLLTFDKDFGEPTWRVELPASSGVILFRIPMPSAPQIEPEHIRMRPLGGR